MAAPGHLWPVVALAAFLISISVCLEQNEAEKDMFSQNIGQLLDYKNAPVKGRQTNHASKIAQDYMTRLFEEFNENSFFKDEVVIRSIQPTAGMLNGSEMLVFKLESIKKDETILRAELHFRQSVKPHFLKGHVMKSLMVTAGCQSSQQMPRVERIKSSSKVWTIWDLKNVANTAMNTNSTNVFVQVYRNNRLFKADSMLHKNVPFLLVYTTPKSSQFSQPPEAEFAAELDPDEEEDEETLSSNRVKRSADSYYGYNFDNENHVVNMVDEQDSTKFQQMQTDSVVDDFLKNGLKSLKSRKQKQRRRKHRKSKNAIDDPMQGFGVKPKNRDKQVTENNSLKILLLGKESGKSERVNSKRCKREKFTVNFRDIGWHDVVIQPTTFDAYYCSGGCDFPLSLDGNPSNHALIQSLYNTMGMYPAVPKVCCAPEKMDSLTLLFFDENGNVVLKNFPQMIVSSCSCL